MRQKGQKSSKAKFYMIRVGGPSLLLGSILCGLFLAGIFDLAYAASLIKIDGSSTVYPVTEAVAEEFQIKNRSSRITVGISGSGGGFKKFCRGETDLSNASRPIKAAEIGLCAENGVRFVELPVAYDGLAVVVNPRNDWADKMTVLELKKMWEPAAEGKVKRWSQIRAGWPDHEIRLFGPGVDSGTFDFFTEAIVGRSRASRGDFTSSEDDNILVQGIAMDQYALGYFGLAYYEENRGKLKLVAVDAGNGPMLPSAEAVEKGTYFLSRPLFIYVSEKSANRPEVEKFVGFYLQEGPSLAIEVGYIPLPGSIMEKVKARFRNRIAGSLYEGKPFAGQSLGSLLKDNLN